jgi:hypothetical protein
MSRDLSKKPEPSPRGEALKAIEADRDGTIATIAAGMPGRSEQDKITILNQMQNHELITLLVGGGDVGSQSFGNEDDYARMVYTALPTPCRVLDTRKYTADAGGNTIPPTPYPIPAGQAREVFSWSIGGQGGDATCASSILGKKAYVVALDAISPGLPSVFPGFSYGTLLSADAVYTSSEWTQGCCAPNLTYYASYNNPPYNKAISVTWDKYGALFGTLAVVSNSVLFGGDPGYFLYSRDYSHYTIDVVGYYEEPTLCAEGTTFINGKCWGPSNGTGTDWYDASDDCIVHGGALPSVSDIASNEYGGFIASEGLWASGCYYDDANGPFCQAADTGFISSAVSANHRCVYTPLTHP